MDTYFYFTNEIFVGKKKNLNLPKNTFGFSSSEETGNSTVVKQAIL